MASRLALPTFLVCAVLALAGCGGTSESSSDAATTTKTTSERVTTPETTPETTPVTTPRLARRTITIRVVDGRPAGGIARPKLGKNESVLLVVRSDAAGELHLHGYDISRQVAAGGTARIAFVAKIPGRFELEMENSGVQLAELTVQ